MGAVGGWDLTGDDKEHLDFTRRLIALRCQHPVFRRRAFLRGETAPTGAVPDAWWFRTDGRKMTNRQWNDGHERCLGLFLNGRAITERQADGERITDDSFLVLINGWEDDVAFTLPPVRLGRRWAFELGTAAPSSEPGSWTVPARGRVDCASRSVTVLRRLS